MGPDSSAGGFGWRRGFGRAAAVLAIVLLLPAAGISGCGGSGHGAETDPEKGSDAAFLNDSLGRELTLLGAYTGAGEAVPPAQRSLVRQLRAQAQEYVDALTKAIRGLGGDTEAEPERLALSKGKGNTAFLTLLYELESAALASYVDAAAQLYTAAPRTLDASLAAGHAQHLVVLREALGAASAAAIPEGFDDGEVPAPERSPGGQG